MTGTLRAGKVAQRVGVNLQTLRYYERRGLLPEPDRSLGGHRLYDEEAVTLLRIIKAAQALGFTLDEISALIDVGSHAHRRRRGLHEIAEAKLRQVREKITALEHIERTLTEVLDAGCSDLAACALEDHCPVPFAEIPVRATSAT
ncbi:MerR family transcriptional regulator [Agromyces aurantiacus]|uniref:MerR family transcriptional regulator n=1 Tax=Agromyces aurantiacus TaxID=165814 RepID=A0ABV9R5W5_9MICO|nr:MerR family transcriptional regulator [Agromyces aurantiacus]MBM7503705.1 DNA-binding transcriptional MerR regulator [Agromyces aurantiacus]